MRIPPIYLKAWSTVGGNVCEGLGVWPCSRRCITGSGFPAYKVPHYAHLALSLFHGCLSVLCYLPAKLSATVPAPAPHFLACCHTPHHSGHGLTLRNYKLQVNSSFYKCPQSWFLSTATDITERANNVIQGKVHNMCQL